jgi:hypothetical protein
VRVDHVLEQPQQLRVQARHRPRRLAHQLHPEQQVAEQLAVDPEARHG